MRSWQSTIMATTMSIVAALAISTVASGNSPIIYEEDHLKCYKVLKDTVQPPPNVRSHVVEMANPQFGQERCKVQTRAAFLCAPTVKFKVDDKEVADDPLGGQLDSDYLCYKMRCENDLTRTIQVHDQFGVHLIVAKQAQMLCTPAQKLDWPSIPCQQAGAPVCSGACDPGYTCDFNGTTCQCHPELTVP